MGNLRIVTLIWKGNEGFYCQNPNLQNDVMKLSRACRQLSHMTAAARCIPPRKEYLLNASNTLQISESILEIINHT